MPDVAPISFDFDGSYFYIGGMNIAKARKYKNILENGNVALDLKTIDPRHPRGIRIYGTASVVEREQLQEGELMDDDHFKLKPMRSKEIQSEIISVDLAWESIGAKTRRRLLPT